MESTELLSLDGDVAKINRRADEFKNQHEALQRNIEMFLPLVMDCIVALYRKIKAAGTPDSARQAVCSALSLGSIHTHAQADRPCCSFIFAVDAGVAEEEVQIGDHVRRLLEVSTVSGCVQLFGQVGRGGLFVVF